MPTAPFRLGNHQFISPEENAPLSRLDVEDRSPIAGAPAPAHLASCVREPDPEGPAAVLFEGGWCGHGEPTFTVFDIALSGEDELEVAIETFDDMEEDEAAEEDEEGPPVRRVLVRPYGSDAAWTVLHDILWGLDEELGRVYPWCPESVIEDDDADIEPVCLDDGTPERFRVSIGLEYPPDAQSVGDISWVTIVATGESEPEFDSENEDDEDGGVFCLLSAETA